MRNAVIGFSEQDLQNLGCATTEDGQRLEFRIKVVEGMCHLCSERKGMVTVQLTCAFCYRKCK